MTELDDIADLIGFDEPRSRIRNGRKQIRAHLGFASINARVAQSIARRSEQRPITLAKVTLPD